ncbi:unnamed protein product [Microthlaspi erraticum]|uniref:Retrotransposon gag domain-containing protein n=1 Tax=Microthlaspi erraticum TaxID=1685480 RepID=A0A6D2KAR4_9BRAS|nr:unnamed protein product [Microthlaspi erraticum]
MTRRSNPNTTIEEDLDIDQLERTLRRLRRERMNPGGEGAPNRPNNPPDQERRANDPPNPAEARADQPAPARDVPPPNPNAPDAAEPLQPPLNPPRPPPAFANGHHRHGDNQGMPQDQPHAPPRRVPNAQHPRHQTMGDFDSSDAFFMDRNPIRPPLPPRNDFEIKPQIIALVKQNQFHGLPTEHPLDHVDTFEEICSTTRVNGVSPDYFKCKLFTFSLSDKALRWVKSLPPQSITTWNEYKGAFLNQFYTKQRSNSIRSKISGFKQDSMESFYEALERFKEYTRSCPNHGFSEGNLWNIFYNGIDHKYKLSLDTASNGNFMTKSVPEAKLLIENLAASDANACPDYNRSVKTTSSSESAQISELRNMVSQLLKSRQGVHAIEDALATNEDTLMDFMRDGAEENLEEVNYIGGNYGNRGFNPPFRAHPNLSYRSNNVENPNDQVYPNQGAYKEANTNPSHNKSIQEPRQWKDHTLVIHVQDGSTHILCNYLFIIAPYDCPLPNSCFKLLTTLPTFLLFHFLILGPKTTSYCELATNQSHKVLSENTSSSCSTPTTTRLCTCSSLVGFINCENLRQSKPTIK